MCGGVVVCRASPAQKAAIVRMMARHKQQRLHVRPRPNRYFGLFQTLFAKKKAVQKAAIVCMMARHKQQRLHVRPRSEVGLEGVLMRTTAQQNAAAPTCAAPPRGACHGYLKTR